MTKTCVRCKQEKPLNEFSPFYQKGTKRAGVTCRKCMSDEGRYYRNKVRNQVFAHYGNFCACCGESRREFLSIDHINGAGKVRGEPDIYRRLIREGFPEGFRTLCFNCNCSIGFHGYCPHQIERQNLLNKENAE